MSELVRPNEKVSRSASIPSGLTRDWPNWWQQLRSSSDWKNHRCLFGLSTGRTGTTTLEYALNLSPEIAAFHEPPPRNAITYFDAYRDTFSNPDQVAANFVKYRAKVIGCFQKQNLIYAETNNFQFAAPVIADLMPHSLFLFFHRHPADYVRSGMRRNWYAGHPWDEFRLKPRESDPAAQQWMHWTPFEKICWFWQACNRHFIDAIEPLSAERKFTISFDELVGSQGQSLLPVFKQLNVAAPTSQQLADVYGQPHNNQTSGDFPELNDWSLEEKETLQRIAGGVMHELGYA